MVFIHEFNNKAHKSVKTVSKMVWRSLEEHSWPGNVRELRNVVERCVLFSNGDEFPIQWLNLRSDQQAVVKRALRDLNIDEKAWKPRPIQYAISKAKNEKHTPDKFPVRTYQDEIVQRVYDRYQQIIKRLGLRK